MRAASLQLQPGVSARLLNLCSCAQSRFCVRQVSYLHSHALCSVKLMKTLFCCLWGFILFICEERYGDKVKGLDDGSRRAVTRCNVPQSGTWHKQDPSLFPQAAAGSVRASLTGKLSPQTVSQDGPSSYYLHKQCWLNFAFSRIFCLFFFFFFY